MKFANLAYLKEIPPQEQFQDSNVIDLLCNPIDELHIDNYPNLQRLRASRCKLTKIIITNCPNLQVIDISQNRSLTSLHLENLPSLRALDLRNTKVTTLNVILPSLEFLDISNTKISNDLPDSPNLLSLDNSGCKFKDFDLLPIATKYQRLQRLRSLNYSGSYEKRIILNLNKLSEHPTLEHVICGYSSVICDSISQKTHITTICLQYPTFVEGTKEQFLSKFHAIVIDSQECDISKLPDYHRMKWEESALLLYGPWGIPETDKNAKITSPHLFDASKSLVLLNDVPSSKETFSDVSDKFDVSVALDRMMGAVFGSALGDCLGVSAEFIDTDYARFAFDVPLSILWNTLHSWQNSDTFYRGTVTDDTEQAILLMRTLGDCCGEMNLAHFACLLKEWMKKGISEHGQKHALDVGGTTYDAITSQSFTTDPLHGSKSRTTRTVGNGCAMRTAPIGCFKFWDLNTVAKYALNFGCVTHFSPICGVCTVLVSVLIAEQIRRASSKKEEPKISSDQIDELIEYSIKIVDDAMKPEFNVEEKRPEIMRFLKAEKFEDLELCCSKIGNVLKATGAAVLALRKGLEFEKAMEEVIWWAGDADTNAAVVGGIIGASVGFSKISPELMKYMYTGNWLYVEFARMCKAMGIEPPESPFLTLSYQ